MLVEAITPETIGDALVRYNDGTDKPVEGKLTVVNTTFSLHELCFGRWGKRPGWDDSVTKLALDDEEQLIAQGIYEDMQSPLDPHTQSIVDRLDELPLNSEEPIGVTPSGYLLYEPDRYDRATGRWV